MSKKVHYSWLDVFLWLAALALLVPLVARFVEAVGRALEEAVMLNP
jgi:hypothetical protein